MTFAIAVIRLLPAIYNGLLCRVLNLIIMWNEHLKPSFVVDFFPFLEVLRFRLPM